MDTDAFLDVSTKLVKDLMDWSDEVTRRDAITAEQLQTLKDAVLVIEQVTIVAVPMDRSREA
jgi:hypothetical protein